MLETKLFQIPFQAVHRKRESIRLFLVLLQNSQTRRAVTNLSGRNHGTLPEAGIITRASIMKPLPKTEELVDSVRFTTYSIPFTKFVVKNPIVIITELKTEDVVKNLGRFGGFMKEASRGDCKTTKRRNASRACRKFILPFSDFPTGTLAQDSVTMHGKITASKPVKRKAEEVNVNRAVKFWKLDEEIHLMCGACEKAYPSLELAKNHEKGCLQFLLKQGGDIRKDENVNQAQFMDLFGMAPILAGTTRVFEAINEVKPDELQRVLESQPRRLRSKRQQVANYFRVNPIPITSNRGQQFIKGTEAGVCLNPGELATQIDKCCETIEKGKLRLTRQTISSGVCKILKFKTGEYVHEYSFTKLQRIKRNSEIVVGVKTKKFPTLNRCKDLRICIKALTNDEIARAKRTKVLPQRHKFVLQKFSIEIDDLKNTQYGKTLIDRFAASKI